jgi:isopenicillin N synthase-like dioxygenase
MAMPQVPELSLRAYTDGSASDKARFTDQLFSGLKEYGFIILRDHPIDVQLLRQAYALSEKLFQLPTAVKDAYVSAAGGGQRGYTPFGREHAKGNRFPDLKEFWHVGRDLPREHRLKSFFADNIWPRELPEFEPAFRRIFQALDDTGRIMLQALTKPLEVDADYFTRMTDVGSSVLRLLHYPPIAEGADPNCIRAAAHEDINLITLLVSASSSGLELLTRDGQWLAVNTSPENIIVDSGDMLSRITNDVIPSSTHRVVNPSVPNLSRYSMPFFMHPNPDAMLSCLPSCRGAGAKYPDIRANEFLMERLREIGLTK